MAKMTVQLASLPVQESYVTLEEKSGEASITPLPYKTVGEQNNRVALTSAQVQSSKKIPHVTYSVVHAIQGRLRLRVPRLRNDADYGQRLQTLLEADPLVTTVKIKPAAASLVVNYKATAVTDAKMRSRLDCLIVAASDPGIVLLNPKKVSPSEEEEKPWPGMQLSVLATGLAVLGGPFGVAVPPIVTAGTIALATLPVFKRAVDGIVKERKLSIDFLDFIAIAITTVQGQFLTPSLMLSLIEIGENIRDRTARSSKMQTLDLLGSLGQFAWV